MKILIFDIAGKFAHFRKYYTNSSSLTYSIPPRTTISGIIAAVMGYERDSYYETFNSENAFIAVKKLSTNKKLIQTVNYMLAKTSSDIINPKKHTQIPYEIITDDQKVRFRIYFYHKDENIMKQLEKRLIEKKYYYSPYLGAASFNCSLEYVDYVEAEKLFLKEAVPIATAVNSKYIIKNSIDIYDEEMVLMREKMPCDFLKDRFIEKTEAYIFDDRGKSVKMKINNEVYSVKYGNEIVENIVFM